MEAVWSVVTYIIIFLYGLFIGSFLNVVIFRVPKKESLTKVRSHCMSCGYQLKWYDLFPLFSWLFLRGRCRKCGEKISAQYPVIEASNAILYVLIFFVQYGVNSYEMFEYFHFETLMYCLMASALLALSVIDFRTYEIPVGFNIFIGALGVINLAYRFIAFGAEGSDWLNYIIGFFCVSLFTFLLFVLSGGRAIGGGDVKLMAAAGLLLGWKLTVLSFVLGCVYGAVIHTIRMKASGADRVLAMGPYLSAGIMTAVLWGNRMIDWYLGFFKK
ncbi:MAG: prepilin peptidase [Clostridiales bacterium]|nr:prepilin peptidase [Clostridiales bacterium]